MIADKVVVFEETKGSAVRGRGGRKRKRVYLTNPRANQREMEEAKEKSKGRLKWSDSGFSEVSECP